MARKELWHIEEHGAFISLLHPFKVFLPDKPGNILYTTLTPARENSINYSKPSEKKVNRLRAKFEIGNL